MNRRNVLTLLGLAPLATPAISFDTSPIWSKQVTSKELVVETLEHLASALRKDELSLEDFLLSHNDETKVTLSIVANLHKGA